ncbi:transporter [Haloferula helveola]|uniref:Transporter n=1 Tax=Haloferula helveola TaxID=490095 RepID=A0ABM7RD73_9BACT|nr:transporter [Haloferula helveola]
MPDTFHFLRPAALLLAPVAVLIWWVWQRRSDPLAGWRNQLEPELLEALVDHGSSKRSHRWPVLVAWLLAVVALSGPSWKPEPSPFTEDATPLIILLKADVSMDTADPLPTRMERAHLKIRDLAAARESQPLGLIAYAGSAHLVLPPTKDTEAVAMTAAEITPEIMPVQGDRLDLAIDRAMPLMNATGGTLLVITDASTAATDRLSESYGSAGKPYVQILAITGAGVSTDGLGQVADSLNSDVIAMAADDSDIDRIVARAARTPVAVTADGGTRWQDGGYLLVPLLCVLALSPFRKEAKPEMQS